MKHRTLAACLALGFTSTLAAAVGAQVHIKSTHEEFPKVLYADTLISANDRCIVAQSRLNPRVRPVYVNGVPIGFC